MTFRQRIIVAFAPLLLLLFILGGAGTILIYRLGNRVDEILRENYDSVIYMRDLNESLERIDSSFQFALAGREADAAKQYAANWKPYNDSLKKESNNVTLPGEADLAESLSALSKRYREQGDAFFASTDQPRGILYFGGSGKPGLYDTFRAIKSASGSILKMNQENMESVDREARQLAHASLLWYGGGLIIGVAVAVLLLGSTMRTILYPIRAVTESATAIGSGNLDQLVSVTSADEIGQLASAFNAMARQLRDLRHSQQGQLTLAQATSQATIDSFPDLVLVIDQQQQVRMANPAAQRLLGVVPIGSGGKQPATWQPPASLRQPLADALLHQREYFPEGFDHAIILRIDEESHSFLPRIAPVHDVHGVTLGATVLLQDITRFRLLDEVKSNLVATVSHELKTPLTSIRLALHLLLEETTGPLEPKQMELLVDARDNAERLLVMINNLLDLARLERGPDQLHLEPQEPASLLRAIAETFRPRAMEQGIDLSLSVPADLPQVAVDADQIQHAFQNLLDNALAYTPQGGRITLGAEQMDGKIAISVTDTGRGIPPQYLSSVFEKYFRVPGNSAHGGSGLGLAIVREIVTAHGGSIECESDPGRRTVFRMYLPIWKPATNVNAGQEAHC